MRRATALVILLPALGCAACGGTPTGDAAMRASFLKRPDVKKLHDDELAKLCPRLYPTDFLESGKDKHYRYTKTKHPASISADLRAAARAAGCSGPGTKPK